MAGSVDLCWNTGSVRRDQRFSYFVEGICRAFTHLDPELSEPESEFFARIRHREVGGAAVTNLSSSKYISRRLLAGIARSEDHAFYLNFVISGTIHGRQSGNNTVISHGDLFILDNALPFELDLRSNGLFDSRIIRLPRTPSLEQCKSAALDFGHRHARHRLMPLLRMNLVQLARTGNAAGDDEIEFFGHTAVRLVDLILTGDNIETIPSGSGPAWHLIRTEIDRRIGDHDFTLEHLAKRLGVSTRYVQKVCAAQDCTFSSYLRERRLAMAASRLETGRRHRSVEEIAHASGFRNLSTFYRCFKRHYGATPGSYRH